MVLKETSRGELNKDEGYNLKLFLDSLNRIIHPGVLVDENGIHTGIPSNPFEVQDSQSLLDSKGRLRHSNFLGTGYDQPETIFDTKQIFDDTPLFWDNQEVSGGSTTSTHSVNTASSTLGVALNTAGVRTHQTFMWHNYLPAKVQHIIQTGVLIASGGGAGIKVWAGQLNDDNGVAFFYDEGTVKVLIRTKTSGSVMDNTVDQVDWDDPMLDGSGRSGKTLDFAMRHIFGISYGWLGTDAVVFWVKIDGEVYVLHIIKNAGNIVAPYMSTPNLPLRWSIENDGTGVASTAIRGCSTVISEGGVQNQGILRHSDSGAISGLSAGTAYAMLGMRLKSTHLGLSVLIENISALATTQNDQAHWNLVLNPIVAGTFDYTDEVNSGVQIAIGSSANTITNGFNVDGGYFSTVAPTGVTTNNALRLGSKIDGTPDELVLSVIPITNNITVHTSMTRRELS